MTTVTADFGEVKISIGDGGDPENFAPFCLVNLSKTVSKSVNLTEDEIPDCDNPGDPMAIVRKVRSVDFSIAGEGKLHVTDLAMAEAWAGGQVKNCQIDIGTAANGGRRWSGAFYLQSFEISAQNKETASASIQLVPVDTSAIVEAAIT